MCLICVELQRSRLTSREAWRALGEMAETLEEDHIQEVIKEIDKKEAEERETEEE